MFRTVQKLLNKEQQMLTKDDMIKLRKASAKPIRKRIKHKVYLCANCGHLYFYAIVRCPLCESHDVQSVNNAKDVVSKMEV